MEDAADEADEVKINEAADIEVAVDEDAEETEAETDKSLDMLLSSLSPRSRCLCRWRIPRCLRCCAVRGTRKGELLGGRTKGKSS